MDTCDHVATVQPAGNHSILNPQKWSCFLCGTTESVYACLSCSHVACGRFNGEHALQHFKDSQHPITIEVNEKHVYCYICDDYVLNDNASGDIQLLRTALSAIATQSFSEVESRGRPLLRSYSYQVSEECSEANLDEDKIATVDIYRRKQLIGRTFHAWRTLIQQEKLEKTPSPKRCRFLSPVQSPSFPSLIKKPSIIPGVTGLRNLGNTCYMNSILQVLSHLEKFRTFFRKHYSSSEFSPWNSPFICPTPKPLSPVSSKQLTRQTTVELFQHLSSPPSPGKEGEMKGGLSGGGTPSTPPSTSMTDPEQPEFVSLCQELHGLFRVVWSGKWAQVSPHALLQAVWTVIPMFKGYSQHDAQEFLCELLDKVQEELVNTRHLKKQSPGGTVDIVSSVFQGELVSQVTCLACGHQSDTKESFMDLSLEFPDRYQVQGPNWTVPNSSSHVTELLSTFTQTEMLEDKIYACEQCNSKRRKSSSKPVILTDAKKQLLITQLPQVLRLHLKRFRWSGRYHREKIHSHVHFEEVLDMEPYCLLLEDDPVTRFRLSGVVIHHGRGFGCGHYTAFTWNQIAESWMHCNDARLELCPLEEVLAGQAYILLYTKEVCDEETPLAQSLHCPNVHTHNVGETSPSLAAIDEEVSFNYKSPFSQSCSQFTSDGDDSLNIKRSCNALW